MKRSLLLSLCLGLVANVASATNVQFTTQNWTLTAGSGVTFNGSGGANQLDLTSTAFNLFTHNTDNVEPGLGNGLTAGNNTWEFFNLGTLKLNESGVDSPETNDLDPFTIAFGLCVGGTGSTCTGGATQTISITGDINASSSGSGFASISFPGYGDSGTVFNFANGAVLEAIIYAGSDIFSGNTIHMDNHQTKNVYVKLWLTEDPTITTNEVPEPGSMALLGSGLVGLGLVARRRRT